VNLIFSNLLNKVDRTGKTDRTARLLKVEHLLYQNRINRHTDALPFQLPILLLLAT